jgi:hypothetical protein
VKRVSFAVTYPDDVAHPLHLGIRRSGAVTRGELLAWGPTDAVTSLTWFDAGESAVAALFEAVDSATTLELVGGPDGTYAFAHQTGFELPRSALDAVAGARVAFLPPVVFHDSPVATVDAVGPGPALGDFHRALGEALETRIRAVGEFRRWPASDGVTDRQWAALVAAVDAGYYDVPRSGGVDDVAEALGCGHSTAGELLRKAEAAVVRGAVASPARPGTGR